MTLLEMLSKIATDYPATEPAQPVQPVPGPVFCKLCRWNEDGFNAAGYCPDCQATIDRGYDIAKLAGRCANGSELGKGVVYHARLLSGDGPEWQAVCGAKPGRRSAGWSTWKPADREVTCDKCLKKLSR